MPRERTWTRIYVDRMKLSSLSNYLGSDKKDELGVKGWLKGPDHGKFDLERVFAKLPSTQVISDTDIDEISDKISMSKKPESVRETVTRLLKEHESDNSKQSPKGELILLEATSPVEEGFTLHRPSGTSLPLLNKGSYLAYRKPFDKLLLFDGTYHSGILFDFVGLGAYDVLKVFLKQSDETDPRALLESWDNSHARILGLLGACPPYECRFSQPPVDEEHKSRISFGLFALVIDVSPFDNLAVAQRMNNWRAV
jgi:hypothetical protein